MKKMSIEKMQDIMTIISIVTIVLGVIAIPACIFGQMLMMANV